MNGEVVSGFHNDLKQDEGWRIRVVRSARIGGLAGGGLGLLQGWSHHFSRRLRDRRRIVPAGRRTESCGPARAKLAPILIVSQHQRTALEGCDVEVHNITLTAN